MFTRISHSDICKQDTTKKKKFRKTDVNENASYTPEIKWIGVQ